ncbi:PREDICTED: ubiquitin-conjugating enzyme E2 32-like [Prunus mume]|uniref:Ubiquitin-conjugating enzyme E2 32-like n=1 Tax=Prunus mume TaxID=102107 RepID=A0ABM0PCI6_PRUMU|nr:PREDICTED: ubiquitin-conjugating enzyme E2 32-like [Prunus mume]
MELDRNRALTRIREEYREIESNPSDDFMCGQLEREEFQFQWQFAVRGAKGTEFEGGIYHGRVLFSGEYPSKPPSIIPLTENGRFKTHTEICLRRLDKWKPSCRVRDVLVDFIHSMPTNPDDELCSLKCSKEERLALAIKSRAAATKDSPFDFERQKLIDQIHKYMLSKAPAVPFPSNGTGSGAVVYNVPNGTGGGVVVYNFSNGTGGGAAVYNFSNGTGGNVIGNAFQATNSDRVGILGSMNEAAVGILGSMNEAFIRGGGPLVTVCSRTTISTIISIFLVLLSVLQTLQTLLELEMLPNIKFKFDG